MDALITLFVKKEKRERMRTLASLSARRADLCHDLLHDTRNLDPAVLTRLDRPTAAAITRLMRPVSRVYCISEVSEVDDQELPLGDALAAVMGRAQDTMLFGLGSSCAYVETHEGEQWLLVRKGAR